MKDQIALSLMVAASALWGSAQVQRTDHGFRFPANGAQVEVEFYNPEIVRVTKVPDGMNYSNPGIVITMEPKETKIKYAETAQTMTAATSALTLTADLASGNITFATPKGVELMTAGATSFTPMNDGPKKSYQVSQVFRLDADESIYGLGLLQNLKLSQRGEYRTLRTGNCEDGVPFFQSIKGYGVYWDNYSPIDIRDDGNNVTLIAETGDAVDYYFMYGGDADGVISCVRELTGDVPMAPLWTFGFMQSRERYKTQNEIVAVLNRYRKDGVPIDCMIQDWQYWGNNYLWNSMEFLNETFSDPKAMMDSIHGQNAKCMISIWQSFGPQTKPYRELDAKGYLFDFETWPSSGISHMWPPRMDYASGVRVYDPYCQESRDIYWDNLRRLYDYGLDGWWMDSTEPDCFNASKEHYDHMTSAGKTYRSLVNAFPIQCVEGVYDHQRATSDSTRAFILTRSVSFGQQRTGANTWSGDVVSTWDMLRKQIPCGLNYSLMGNPNYNSDLGGFFSGSYNGSYQGKPGYENPAFHELYVRWMQHGVFYPMMRSHGADTPRELYLYGKPGEPVYDALLGSVKLRYQLLPYLYSTAWQVSKNRDTFMRALLMDFPNDPEAVASKNSYMFGRNLLTTPVIDPYYTPEVVRNDADANAGWDSNTGRTTLDMGEVDFSKPITHKAYLPAGAKWYYFHNNQAYDGGQTVELVLPFTEAPFFVKAGAILPIGPDVQYTSEKPWDDLEIRVYPGADGEFTLYEDAGDGYNYEKGEYTEITFKWNDRARRLTVADRNGAYPGMLENRNFRVRVMDNGKETNLPYVGKKKSIIL